MEPSPWINSPDEQLPVIVPALPGFYCLGNATWKPSKMVCLSAM